MCPVCAARPAETGVLCEECCDELAGPIQLAPEQIQRHGGGPLTRAALVDAWGRPHRLAARTEIGRQVDNEGIAVLEPSVSRHHALLEADGDDWRVRDLGSANGTWCDDQLAAEGQRLRAGARVRFGYIGFYLIADVDQLPIARIGGRTTTTTLPHAPRGAPAPRPVVDEEPTDLGLPQIHLKLHEPTGGGGGVIEVNRKTVQLTATQFELMVVIIRRMVSEASQPELVRGFVRSSELIADLSWDTREPTDNHVKQLVRRVRRVLMKAEVGDLIESRHRFGYRLRAVPVME